MPTWESWSGEINLPVQQILTPGNLAELIAGVRMLETQRGDRVHSQGSRWAFSAPAYCEDFVIDTDKLNAFQGALQAATYPAPTADKYRIAVEAGIKVAVLYTRLAGRPDSDIPPHLPIPAAPFPPSPRDKWMLPVLGGAGGQSIAGAINTGTHGGDAGRAPLSDAVLAMLMVGTNGELRLLQREVKKGDLPVVNVLALRDMLGLPVTDFRDTDLFNAAVVSVGRFGVVYAYVLEAVDESDRRIIEFRKTKPWSAVKPGLLSEIAAAVTNDTFLQVVFYPARLPDGDRTCFVTTHSWAPFPAPREAPLPPNVRAVRAADGLRPFMQMLCQDHLTPQLIELRANLAALLPAVIALGPVALALLPFPFNALASAAPIAVPVIAGLLGMIVDRLGLIGPDYRLGDIVADILNTATDLGAAQVGDMLGSAILGAEQGPYPTPTGEVSGTRFEIADFFDYETDCYRGDSVEIFFEVNERLLDKIELVLGVFDRLRARGIPFGGYVSLRFMARSNALLALSRWTTTCSIEVSVLRGLRGNLEVMSNLQQIAIANDGAVHWGQQNDLAASAVRDRFGSSLTTWQRQLQRVERDSLLFRNSFTFSHGLEVPLALRGTGDPWSAPWERLEITVADGRDAVAVADAGAGRPLQLFAAGSDSLIVTRTRPLDGSPDSAWTPILPAPVAGRPVAMRGVSGRIEIFVLDRNLQRVKHTWELDHPGGAFAPWDTLGFLASIGLASDTGVRSPVPSAAAHLDGRLELVARAALFEGTRRMVNAWAHFVDSGWSDVVWRGDESIGSPPSMCLRNLRSLTFSSDQMAVTALSAAGKVLFIQQIGPDGRSGWTEWANVNPVSGSALVAAGQPIIVAEPGPGAPIQILAMSPVGELNATSELRAALSLTWAPWQQLDTSSGFDFLDASCRPTTVVTDRIYVFARSQRGEILEIEFLPGSGWGRWMSLGGETDSDLAAGVHIDGRVEVIARSQAEGQIYARRQVSPGRWS